MLNIETENCLSDSTAIIKQDKKSPFEGLMFFLKFFLLTIPAGLMQFASIFIFEQLLHIEHWIAFLIGFACATTWNFTVNRKKTFGSSVDARKAVTRVIVFYLLFTSAFTLFNWLWQFIPWGAYVYLGSYIATFLTMVANLIGSYFLCKHLTRVCGVSENKISS